MSTRASIAYSDRYHLWDEAFEHDGGVYLEMRRERDEDPPLVFEACPNSVTVRIDQEAFRAMVAAYCKQTGWRP